jgi:hypothetical protein
MRTLAMIAWFGASAGVIAMVTYTRVKVAGRPFTVIEEGLFLLGVVFASMMWIWIMFILVLT